MPDWTTKLADRSEFRFRESYSVKNLARGAAATELRVTRGNKLELQRDPAAKPAGDPDSARTLDGITNIRTS